LGETLNLRRHAVPVVTARVLTDDDVDPDPNTVVRRMRLALQERGAETLMAPPRWSMDVGTGSLVFTAGAAFGLAVMGFRVYETVGRGEGHEQLVAVWNLESGRFHGAVVGDRVGVLRTAGINAAAIDELARRDARTLGVLGTGPQARAGANLACSVREFAEVRVYSPTRDHRETFAERMPDRLGTQVESVDDPADAVREVDVLYCATDSEDPVFEAGCLADEATVCSLGRKSANAHELPVEALAEAGALVTDSLPWLDEYGDGFLGEHRDRVVELGDVVRGDVHPSSGESSVFLSVGLAGTEVVLADALL
jgi:ornithine cyclodeaminase/alanine dehydrogenase